MRAGMMLEALAADHDVHLLVLPVVLGSSSAVSPEVSRWCARVAVHPVAHHADALFRLIARVKDPRERLAAAAAYPRPVLCRFATPAAVASARWVFGETPFDVVHVFRVYLAPFAEPYLEAGRECRLDLDDHESRTRERLAEIYEASGQGELAATERKEAEKYAALERRELPRFGRVYVCSERDRADVAALHPGARVATIPNGVRVPGTVQGPPDAAAFTLLFLGSLGYYPNEDAAVFFCSEVLPRIRTLTRREARVRIVGTRPSRRLRDLAREPGVDVVGPVADVATAYADAHAVVVPLRAGGGTRIKILEAFAYRRPVVSTSLGAEGLDVRRGEHLLVGDTPEALAAQCVRVVEEPPVAAALVERALEFVRAHHSRERILELVKREYPARGAGAARA